MLPSHLTSVNEVLTTALLLVGPMGAFGTGGGTRTPMTQGRQILSLMRLTNFTTPAE